MKFDPEIVFLFFQCLKRANELGFDLHCTSSNVFKLVHKETERDYVFTELNSLSSFMDGYTVCLATMPKNEYELGA
jgi:hypothetical protein